MMQPGGVAPPPMSMDQQQHHQQPQYAPQQQQPWMMMPHQQQQQPAVQPPQVPQMWGQQQQPMAAPPQPQQYGVAPPSGGASASDEVRSLWIGDLQYWMDENYLHACFYPTGELVNAKVIRNKLSGQSEGYGFVEFRSHASAEHVLQSYNGTPMPNAEQNYRLNWATLGAGEKRADESSDFTIFVGDLAADVTDYLLQETFKARYTTVKGAKVVTDRTTGRSKGYGFVRFGDESEQTRAMSEMNGVLCSTRPMRIGPAANKKASTVQQYQKGKREALVYGGLELISAEMIPI